MNRLLAVNLNYLGDALFTTPALDMLRARFAGATLDVLAGERAAAILSGHPAIDRLIVRPPRGGADRAITLASALRAGRYDGVVLFQTTLLSATLSRAFGVPLRIGFAQEGSARLLTHAVPPRRQGEHDVDAYLRLVRAGREGSSLPGDAEPRLSIAVSPEDRAFAQAFLHVRELAPPVVGLVIGATRPQKRWPEAYFVRLADTLWSAAGVSCVLIGGPEEEEAARHILAAVRSPLVSTVGKTTEKQLAALTAQLGLIVSGDSGPLHIAVAMGAPVVALFGSTDPAETGPWRASAASVLYDHLACAPCRKSPSCEGRFDCLRAITPERVVDAVLALLGVRATGRSALPMAVTEDRG
jgi:lipopolysaccharide heptosyltransferase II